MSDTESKVSIVCPAFNEEEVLPHFHAELRAVLATLESEYDFEIIYIDDGSTDRTLEILRVLAASDPRVRYLSLSRNFGPQAALTAGIESARGDALISLDSDLQHPPSLIPTLLQSWKEGNDVVLTEREDDPYQPWLRRVTSRGFFRVMKAMSDRQVQVAASDYRLLSRKAVDGLLQLRESHRFLRGMVNWMGFKSAVVRFKVAPRGAGVSKFTMPRLTSLSLDAMLSFSNMPRRLPLYAGLVTLMLGAAFGAYGLLAALFGGGWQPGGVAVLTALHLIGGAVLCSLGLLGEYVGRVYEQVKGRPLYLLKETSPHTAAVALPAPPPFKGGSRDGATAA
jgi:glycosyltransferase involved in cell wall biosynthesis